MAKPTHSASSSAAPWREENRCPRTGSRRLLRIAYRCANLWACRRIPSYRLFLHSMPASKVRMYRTCRARVGLAWGPKQARNRPIGTADRRRGFEAYAEFTPAPWIALAVSSSSSARVKAVKPNTTHQQRRADISSIKQWASSSSSTFACFQDQTCS